MNTSKWYISIQHQYVLTLCRFKIWDCLLDRMSLARRGCGPIASAPMITGVWAKVVAAVSVAMLGASLGVASAAAQDDAVTSERDDGRLTVLVWHYHRKVRKAEPGKKPSRTLAATVRVQDAADVWKGPVRLRRWMVGPRVSNAYHLFQTGQALDERCELQQVDERVFQVTGGVLDVSLAMPPLSVSLIEIQAKE